jgi:hypothetical protein
VAQMVHVRPVRVLYLRDKLRLEPAAFGHLVGRETLTSPALVPLGQIRKGATLDFEPTDTPENLHPKSRNKSVAHNARSNRWSPDCRTGRFLRHCYSENR